MSTTIGSDGTVSIQNAERVEHFDGPRATDTRAAPEPRGPGAAEGRNLLAETASSGRADHCDPRAERRGADAPGLLERSNVEIVSELINLILAQRAVRVQHQRRAPPTTCSRVRPIWCGRVTILTSRSVPATAKRVDRRGPLPGSSKATRQHRPSAQVQVATFPPVTERTDASSSDSAALAGLTPALGEFPRPTWPLSNSRASRRAAGSYVVTLGEVAFIAGGDEATRARAAKIDLVEPEGPRVERLLRPPPVEYRLVLAGLDANSFRATACGEDHHLAHEADRAADEVVSAAKAELLRSIGTLPESTSIELAQPVVVKLPEVPAGERVVIVRKAARGGRDQRPRRSTSPSVPAAHPAILRGLLSPAAAARHGRAGRVRDRQSAAAARSLVIIRPRQGVDGGSHGRLRRGRPSAKLPQKEGRLGRQKASRRSECRF